MSPLLSVQDLSVVFKTSRGDIPAVRDVSFELEPGQRLGLVGESGSGKTVSALSVLGLLPSHAKVGGSVLFRGEELLDREPSEMRQIRGAEIAMIYQDATSSFNPAYTVVEQIAETLRRHKSLGRRAARDRTLELLSIVGIPSAAERTSDYPAMYSGGMLQRAMIAMALSCEPQVLIADEPTTALDATVQAQIIDLLERLCTEFSMALLFLTHDFGLVARLCERVAVMYAGQIVESRFASGLFERPRHPYSEALLAAAMRRDEEDDGGLSLPISGSVPHPSALPPGCSFAPRCPYKDEIRCAKPQLLETLDDDCRVRCIRATELTMTGTG